MRMEVIEMPPDDASPHEGANRYPYLPVSGADDDFTVIVVREVRKPLTPEPGLRKCCAFHFTEGYKAGLSWLVSFSMGAIVAWVTLKGANTC